VLFKSTKEIVATYTQSSELQCQLKIKIPLDYPLKSVQVDIGEQLKIKQQKIRNWTLSIRNLLHTRNGDIISAILLWKKNIDKEMEGVEECYICYSVMHASDKSLPTMQCRSCSNKFHVGCIRKWFNTSNKSNCPLCQNFFF
jgi:E3 ubiquitin-protein ligase listerin